MNLIAHDYSIKPDPVMPVCDVHQGQLDAAKRTNLRVSLSIFEVAIMGFAVLITFGFCFLLKKTRMLTGVSKVLISNAIFAEYLVIVSRCFIIAHMLCEETLFGAQMMSILAFVHDSSLMMMNLNEIAIVFACWITLVSKDEPKLCAKIILNSIVVVFPWAFACLLLLLEWKQYIPSIPLQIAYCIINVATVLALSYLSKKGRAIYENDLVGNVPRKYWACVQIRTVKVLMCIGVLTIIRTSLTNGVLIYIKTNMIPYCLFSAARDISFVIDISIAFHWLLQPIVMVLAHPGMLKALREKLGNYLFLQKCFPNFATKVSPLNTIDVEAAKDDKNGNKHGNRNQPKLPPNVKITNVDETDDDEAGPSTAASPGKLEAPVNVLGRPLYFSYSQEEHFMHLEKAWR
ncbi:hypothetical protein M3Y97_01002300 [Aphelenchoides bicaudatus]|nr:hypothetical protein M3Y97_01002300 [Aphelenchoides bicaudatus]